VSVAKKIFSIRGVDSSVCTFASKNKYFLTIVSFGPAAIYLFDVKYLYVSGLLETIKGTFSFIETISTPSEVLSSAFALSQKTASEITHIIIKADLLIFSPLYNNVVKISEFLLLVFR